MKLAALEHGKRREAGRLGQPDLHVGAELGEAMQEARQHAVDHLRRRRHLQEAGIAAPHQLRPLAERADGAQDAAAIREQPLAFPGQHQPAADAIEQLDPELRFEVADLA